MTHGVETDPLDPELSLTSKEQLFDYIEAFYTQRRHSALGYESPAQYERSARLTAQYERAARLTFNPLAR
jgi:hypothetical protein